jgi:hypothetical protein
MDHKIGFSGISETTDTPEARLRTQATSFRYAVSRKCRQLHILDFATAFDGELWQNDRRIAWTHTWAGSQLFLFLISVFEVMLTSWSVTVMKADPRDSLEGRLSSAGGSVN